MPHTNPLADALRGELANTQVIVDVPTASVTDWFGRSGHGDVMVRARHTADVSTTLRICSRFGAVVIPVGGNTGLVGGTVSQDPRPTVTLDLTGLRGFDFDPATNSAVVGAGTTIADLQSMAADHGLTYGVDLASRDSATVGGTIATNAGGVHVCAYGSTRAQVMGLQCVLADGTVLEDLRGLPKDNSGYSWRELVVGSEGTLAVITAARLTLHLPPGHRIVIAGVVADLARAVALGRRLGSRLSLLACEIVDAPSWGRAAVDLGLRDPVPDAAAAGRYVLILELDGGSAVTGGEVVELLADDLEVLPLAVVATDRQERADLWRVREAQAEWWAQQDRGRGMLHKYDVALPLSDLDNATDALMELVAGRPGPTQAGVFGHVFEGSLHVQLLARDAATLDEQILRLVSERGGTLSAEHGIGRDKARWLALRRSSAEVTAMRAIKTAWDPAGTLNPGVLFVN